MSSTQRIRAGVTAVVLVLASIAPAPPAIAAALHTDTDLTRFPVHFLHTVWDAAVDWLAPLLGVVVAADCEDPPADPDDPFGGSGGDPGGGSGVLDPNGGGGSGGSAGGGI